MRIDRNQFRTLVIVGTLSAAFVGALWLPRKLEERKLHSQIESMKQEIRADEATGQDLKRLSDEVAAMRKDAAAMNRHLAEETEVADVLRQLSADLETHGTREHETQTQTIAPGKDFSLLPVAVSFRSSCASMFEFLKTVEQSPRLMRVTRMQLTGDSNAPGEVRVRLELCTFLAAAEAEKP